MKKRYLSLIAVLMMLVSVTSCGSEDSTSGDDLSGSVSSAAGTAPAAVTSVKETGAASSAADSEKETETASSAADPGKETEAPADELPAMEQAYKVLDCLDVEGTPSEIASCGNNAVIKCLSADENDRIVLRYYVVDAVNDRLLRTIDNCEPFEMLLGIDAEGTVTASDMSEDTQKLIYYKPDGSRTVRETEDIIDRMECDASGQLYTLDKGVIGINSDGSRQVIFDSEEAEGVEFYDAARSRAVADYCNESFTVRKRLVLVDTSTGRVIADLGTAAVTAAESAGDYIAVTGTSDQDSSEQICSVFEKETGSLTGTYSLKDRNTDYSFCAGSSYGIAAERPEGSDSLVFDLLRVSDGATGSISADIPDAERAVSTGITAADRFLSAVVINDPGDGKFRTRLVMTDPGQVNFDGSLVRTDPPVYPEEKECKCGEKYKKLRAEADRIEEKYGVRILVGDEVLAIEDVSDLYGVVSDESSSASKFAYESSESALQTIDSVFAGYPEGFFEKFRRNGKGGLCIALCDSFTNKLTEDGFYPGGETMSFGAWEIIAIASAEVDSQTGNIIHHEMFHAVEDIVSRKIGGIRDAEWDALNPGDFSYTGDLDEYSDGNTPSDHIYGSDEDPFFCSEYSKVTPQEDRATLIEGLFTDACSASEDDMTYIEDVQEKYPHLKAKYEYLGKWTSQLFGYIYWEKMLGIEL